MSPDQHSKTGHQSGSQHSTSSSQPSSASQPPGQGGQQAPQGGQPTNEQLIQYMMIAKGMNREAASEELFENPDPIKQEYAKLQQIMCSQGGGQGGQQSATGQAGQAGQSGSSGQSSGH